MKKISLLCFSIILVGCASEPTRKVRVIDDNGNPIKDVAPIPQYFYGKGSKYSDEKGFLYVRQGPSMLMKRGYETLQMGKNDQQDTYVLKKSKGSEE